MISLTPLSSVLGMSGDGKRIIAHTQNDGGTPRFQIFDNEVSKGFMNRGSAADLSNNGSYIAVEENNTAFLYGINLQGVVSLIGTPIPPTDSLQGLGWAGAFRLNTANAIAKINITNSELINLATSYGSTTEICSPIWEPTQETRTSFTSNEIVTTDSNSEINGFSSHPPWDRHE